MVWSSSIPLRKFTDKLPCDRIQFPPAGPFCSKDLIWYSETAWIPENRLEDFIVGEEHRPYCNTSFKTTNTEEFPTKCTAAERVRSKKRFHCTYGPKDARKKVESNLPDSRTCENGAVPLRHTILTGYSVRRGCQCHFYVTRFEHRKHAVQITWVNREHVDEEGRPCHGFLDKSAEFHNAQVAPRLSRRTWNFLDRLVRTGVSTHEIQRAHFKNLRTHLRNFFPSDKDDTKRWSRDMKLTPKDLKSVRQSVLRKKVDYNTADHLAVDSWTVKHKEKVFLYQQKKNAETPFLLGWASDWQIHKAATLGHGRTIAMDATFGTNIFDMSLFTILAYDEHQNGVPIAWGLMEKAKREHLTLFLQKLKERVESARREMLLEPEWRPTCFLIDVACEEILSLRNVFPGIPILLCLWHVRRAWTKNLMSKVKNPFNRANMNKELRELMYNASTDHNADNLAFMARWKETKETFTDYFKTYWHQRLERWMVKFRNYDHANQNTNGAVERWHHTLKMHLRTEKATKSGRSVIWLLGMLADDMEHFYWCMLSLKHQGAIRNKVKEGYVWKFIHKARSIADAQVTYLDPALDGRTRAEVKTYKEDGTEKIHLVENYNRDNCVCTCGHSEQGNTCKHQIKLLVMEGYTEMKLFNLLGTKWGSCCGGLEYEYEQMAGTDVNGDEEVQHDLPQEVDISFPLSGFQALAEENRDSKEEEGYHNYSGEWFFGLMHKAVPKLEKMGSQMKNLAAIRFKEVVEWICNEEAIANPPDIEEFPMSQFIIPDDSENTLKRKKDYVETFWDKKLKGTRGKENAIGGKQKEGNNATKAAWKKAEGWKKVTDKPGRKQSSEATAKEEIETCNTVPAPRENVDHATHEQGPECNDLRGKEDAAGQSTIQDKVVPLPFLLKKKRKETDQEKLDRLARESLNLNNHPMDYEPPTPPGSPTTQVTKKQIGEGKGKAGPQKPKHATPNSSQSTQASTGGDKENCPPVQHLMTGQNAPKRRGRPLGSKNKPKNPPVDIGLQAGNRIALGALPNKQVIEGVIL